MPAKAIIPDGMSAYDFFNTPARRAKRRATYRRRMARLREVRKLGRHSRNEFWELQKEFNHRCVQCECKDFTYPDHIIPVSLGGLDTIENIQPLCEFCNHVKGNRDTTDWKTFRRQNGFSYKTWDEQ